MAKQDLILLHAPSVYDFRKEFLFYGPVSDLVPSTPVFEMYPFGFMTIAAYLQSNGYKVRIVNLASMMLNDADMDVDSFLAKLDADVFGIDLHWLPHAQGSLEVAKLLRSIHPQSRLLFGGYSSTYYHDELIRYPQVDLVMRGDSTEVPMLELMVALENDRDLRDVPNLSWKAGGKVVHNPMTFIPNDIDYIDVDYGWIVRSVIRHRDLEGHKPFKDWDRYPLTAVFTARGCDQRCVVCGGSCSAMNRFLGRSRVAFRTPERLAEDIRNIQNYLRAPTFVVGDLRQGGKDYADRFFKEAKALGVDNHLVLELFSPAPATFFKKADSSLAGYSIEFSPDSHEERVRHALGKRFNTPSMERCVANALRSGCERFDLFFMIGLPQQTRESALASAEYARRLYSLVGNDERLFTYTSPLAPFLDPGSYAFEHADEVGYRLLARTLEEHRSRLVSLSWKYVLSYETKWMTRDDIVDASYDTADILNHVRFDCGHLSEDELELRLERTDLARQMMEHIDAIVAMPDGPEKRAEMERTREQGRELMEPTICQKSELEWKSPSVVKSIPRAMMGLMRTKKRA